MDLNDARLRFALLGALAALVAGVVIAGALVAGHRGEKAPPPPASRGGLVIDSARPQDERLSTAKPLRCFVAGQFVGDLTLADCAKRNGVATDALDVGVDPSGALAAAQQGGAVVTPLPPAPVAVQAPPTPAVATPQPASAPAGPCWRYADGQWRKLPTDQTLNACVQTLFAGRCERQGGATYGRWMQQTLRLVPGRVEVSADNHSFRSLAEQGASCAIGPIG